MKKKLVVMLLAAVVVFGFATQNYTHAEYSIPRITSIQGPTSFALSN